MIEAQRPPFSAPDSRVAIVSVGSAAGNALDRIVLDGVPPGVALIAINTDSQALSGSVAPHKLQIGENIARGFGAGGDPETGRAAAEESAAEIQRAIGEAPIVFLLAGLGGGTGSGAAPLVAEIAREANALVVAFATMPFAFEGKRRIAQAEEALAALQANADIVICFENDKMALAVSPKAPIHEAFAAADHTLSKSVRALAATAQRRGLVHAGFDEIASALRGDQVRCVFGYGEADGDNRAHEALALALKNPLLDRARLKGEVEAIVVTIAGGPDLTLNEVQILMEELNRYLHERARLFFGLATESALTGRLTVTILGGFETDAAEMGKAHAAFVRARHENSRRAPAHEAEGFAQADEEELTAGNDAVEMNDAEETVLVEEASDLTPAEEVFDAEPEPASHVPAAPPPASASRRRAGRPEQMHLEPVNRGRFEKSEPTIIDGEDLDVPTFLRRKPTRK